MVRWSGAEAGSAAAPPTTPTPRRVPAYVRNLRLCRLARPAASRAHGRRHRAPRSRRRRRLRDPVRQPRPPSPQHHRPRGRPPARGQRGRDRLARLQRRGLQLPRAARRARGRRPHLPHALRLRGHRPRLRGVGPGLRRALQRHVGVRRGRPARRRRGRARRQARAEPRPLRHQAALLRTVPEERPPALRQRDQGAAAGPRAGRRARRADDLRVPAARVPRPPRRDVLQGRLPRAVGDLGRVAARRGRGGRRTRVAAPGMLAAPLESTPYWTPVPDAQTAATTRPTSGAASARASSGASSARSPSARASPAAWTRRRSSAS